MTTSLFGGSSGAAGGGAVGGGGGGQLVSFHAGKCTVEGDNTSAEFRVVPQKEKGTVSLSKESGMLTWTWRNRETGAKEELLLLDDVKYSKCKSSASGRVYYLMFLDGSKRREFFWMQSADPSKDEEQCKKVNAFIKGDSSAQAVGGSASAGGAGGAGFINPEELEVLNALNPEEREQTALMLGLDPSQLAGLLGGAASAAPETPAVQGSSASGADATPAASATPAAPPPVRPAPSAESSQLDPQMLQNLMTGVNEVMRQRQAAAAGGASLTDILSPEQVSALLDKEEFTKALLPLLPEGQQTLAGLRENVQSPQYKQALAALDSALQSGDLATSMGQFGVDPAAVAAAGGGVVGLAAAIQQQADAMETAEEASGKPADGDAKMEE